MSRRITREVFVRPPGARSGVLVEAVVDTGTALVVLPKGVAKDAGFNRRKPVREDELRGFGRGSLPGLVFLGSVDVVGSGCAAETEIFVPDNPAWPYPIVGSLFWQQTKAVISYQRTPHAVTCRRERRGNPQRSIDDPSISFGEYPLGAHRT